MATIDSTLLCAVMAAQAALLRVFLDREADAPARRWPAAAYWAALGVGLMLKGPVILLVSWGTLLALAASERRAAWWRRLYPAWGVPLMLLLVRPWCVAIWVRSHGTVFSNLGLQDTFEFCYLRLGLTKTIRCSPRFFPQLYYLYFQGLIFGSASAERRL